MNKTEVIIKQREKERLLEELVSLERQEASVYRNIFWTCFTMFVVNPLIAVATAFYIYKQIKDALTTASRMGAVIIGSNLESQILWITIGFGVWFIINLLALLFYLWKASDLKSQMAEVKRKVYRLDVELAKEYVNLIH